MPEALTVSVYGPTTALGIPRLSEEFEAIGFSSTRMSNAALAFSLVLNGAKKLALATRRPSFGMTISLP
jgi:hypothetical protein